MPSRVIGSNGFWPAPTKRGTISRAKIPISPQLFMAITIRDGLQSGVSSVWIVALKSGSLRASFRLFSQTKAVRPIA